MIMRAVLLLILHSLWDMFQAFSVEDFTKITKIVGNWVKERANYPALS